jgi:preprotein translocase subunit SecG
MVTIILVIHLIIAILMIGLILLQKNEGGAAGASVGGAVSVESMMRPRARPNPLGRATSVLGLCFFATSLGLALLARPATQATSIMAEPVSGPAVPKVDEAPAVPAPPAAPPAAPTVPNN